MRTNWILAGTMLAVAAAAPARAQVAAGADGTGSGERLERVEVTGTRLKRTDAETPSPVQLITREEIARSGAATLGDVLQQLPANNTFSLNENGGGGAAAVSLRGLGAQATLVLVNGRRLAPFGFPLGVTPFVDLAQIPLGAVDRIEVLLDGASAIYGSDAVAGVVNVILRREFRGAQAIAAFGRSTHGDADQRQATLTFGHGALDGDGYNVFASYLHLEQDPVRSSARDRSRTVDYRRFGLADMRSTDSYPGNLYRADDAAFLEPLAPCVPLREPGAAGDGRCITDHAQSVDLVVASRRDSLLVAGAAALGKGFELFGDAMFSRTAFTRPGPGFTSLGYFFIGTLSEPFIRLPVGHPQNPYPFEVALRTRFNDVPRTSESRSDTQRVVAGIRHRELAGWDVESALLWAHTRTDATNRGIVNDRVLVNEVLDASRRASTAFIFGNPAANDAGLMARLYPTFVDVGRTSAASIDVRGTREIVRLPAGPVGLAVGAELRRERYTTEPDPLTVDGQISFLSAVDASGSRTVGAAYAELSVPVTATLEAALALRYDHYSDFGSTTNPKLGVKWKALPGLALRGTYASGFRAPSIVETTLKPSKGFTVVRDPQTCPLPDPVNPNCDLFVTYSAGANPALQPERARSFTAGLVFEPSSNASVAIDAFRIRRRNEITFIDQDYLLAHEAEYPGYVVRRADGTIEHLNFNLSNLASTSVWGVDIDAQAKAATAIGRFGVHAVYDWLPHAWIASVKGATELDYAGTYTQPKSRARLAFSFERGPWRSGLTFNYTGKYLRAFTPSDLTCPYDADGTNRPELCSVKAWLTTDLFVGYTGIRDLELGLSIVNLDNVQPPFDERRTTNIYTAYNPTYHSAVGRFFRLTAKYTFR